MIFNLVHKSLSSLVKTSVTSTFRSFFSSPCFLGDANKFNLSCRSFSVSTPMRGLDEFFENGQAYPIYEQDKKVVFGRAWKASELRHKSFEDLHKLWFVLLKERNLLATQEAESRRLGQMFFGKHRELKCKLSMSRLKTVLTERQMLHNQAVNLVAQQELGKVDTESDLVLRENQKEIYKRAEITRKVRKSLNYMKRRQVLFV